MTPSNPFKVCPHFGCGKLTTGGRCPEHKRQARQTYDKDNRDPAVTRWRNTAAYRKRRDMQRRMKPICEHCGTAPMAIMHHADGNPFNMDDDNLISVCFACHEKTKRNQ